MTDTENQNTPRVLIVEDDAFIALDLESVMQAARFDVAATVSRVSEAMKFLDEETPDLVLLDYNLGDHTSTPIAKRLSESGVPFMFVSGQTRDVVLSGLDDVDCKVLGKPFRPKELIQEARAVAYG